MGGCPVDTDRADGRIQVEVEIVRCWRNTGVVFKFHYATLPSFEFC